MNKVFIKIIL